MVCSSEEAAGEPGPQELAPLEMAPLEMAPLEMALKCVADAIDRLDASRRAANTRDLEAQVAAIWAMVGAMDPHLAKVASKYTTPP